MKRARNVRSDHAVDTSSERAAEPASVSRLPFHVAPPRPAPAGLFTARVSSVDGDEVTLEIGGRQVSAARDATLHPRVLEGARLRGERVLVEREEDGALLVLGALRTQPTPGVDVADEYVIEAERVVIRGEEVALSARTAGIVVRALGEVETYADRILSRAEGVHKIVGRMLRLN